MTTQTDVILHEFMFSNYCEKVRWAFAHKGIVPKTRDYLAFMHMRPIKKLSGQTSVPVAEFNGEVVSGSAAIVDRLESDFPQHALYPDDHNAHEQAMIWQAEFDEIGANIRGAMFYDWMIDKNFMFKMLTVGRKGAKFSAYKLMFSLMFPKMKKMLSERAPDPDALRNETAAILDKVARASADTGYLVGSKFSIADLTAAAILYPVFFPPETPSAIFADTTDAGRTWLRRWESHPAGEYVRRMFSSHRMNADVGVVAQAAE